MTTDWQEMFQDDATGQWSLSRLMVATLIIYYMVAFYGKDIPVNLAGLIALMYGINKTSSTVTTIKDATQ